MILAIDIGNTNVVLGGIEGNDILFEARMATDSIKTSDQYCAELKNILALFDVVPSMIDGTIVASVVPPVLNSFRTAIRKLTGKSCLVVGPGIRTGLNILQITVILDFLLLQEIRRIFLVVGYDAAVKGITKHFRNVRCKPLFLSQRRQPSSFLKLVLDGCYSHSTQVHIINHSHRLCLFGVDDHLLADTVVSEDIPIAVEHTVLHRGLLSGFYTDGCLAALVLCKRCHDRKPQFTVAVKALFHQPWSMQHDSSALHGRSRRPHHLQI